MEQHFNKEMVLRKEIIGLERMVSSCNLEASNAKLDIYKIKLDDNPTVNLKAKQDLANNRLLEMEKHQKLLNDKYIAQSELLGKRKTIQALMSAMAKDTGSTSLTFTYKYYLANLDKLTLENRKEVNKNTIQEKKNDLVKLEDQIRKRDKLLFNIKNKLKNKGETYDLDERIVSLNHIEKNPMTELPLISSVAQETKTARSRHGKKNLPYYQRRNSKVKITSLRLNRILQLRA